MRKKILISLMFVLLFIALGAGTLALAQEVIVLDIDIKPCKEPNVLNVNQPGDLPVAIFPDPDQGIELTDIDPDSLTLQGEDILEFKYKDGYLLVKFDTQAVLATLGDFSNGNVFTLTLEGQTKNEISFSGEDNVVIRIGGKKP